MAFNSFTKPFTDAYAGFGRYSVAASAGAVAAALIAPAWLKTDDRGYAQTAAITTPLIAAAFAAAPGALGGLGEVGGQFWEFWKTKPLRFSHGLPVWDAYADLASKVGNAQPHVRSALHGMVHEKALDYYASIVPRPYDTAHFSQEAISRMQAMSSDLESVLAAKRSLRAAGEAIPEELTAQHRKLFGQRRYLSYALEDAERSVAPPGALALKPDTVGVRVRSFENLLGRAEKQQANEAFVRRLSARVQTAGRIDFGYEHISYSGDLPLSGYERMDAASAAVDSRAAAAEISKAEALHTAIERGWIGEESRIVWGLDKQGERTHMLGAEIVSKKSSYKRAMLPFLLPGEPTVAAGNHWDQRATAVKFYDEKSLQAPDEVILANLSRPHEEVQKAVEGAFHYGGVEDRGNAMDVLRHSDHGSVPPDHAVALRSRRARPNPFSSFGGKNYADLEWDEQAAVHQKAMQDFGLVKVGSEGGLAEGKLEERILGMLAPGELPSTAKQEATNRALAKDMYLDPASLAGLPEPRLDTTAYSDLQLGSERLPFVQAREGMVTPQVKSLLGDIPEEAETSVLKAMDAHAERARFRSWKAGFLKENHEVIRGLRRQRQAEAVENLSRWYDDAQIAEFWKNSPDYRAFQGQRVAQANQWWHTPQGAAYSAHARSAIGQEIGHIYQGDELTAKVEDIFGKYQAKLMEDPLNVVAARRAGSLGEVVGLYSGDLDQAKVMRRRGHFVESLSFDPSKLPEGGLELGRDQPIGMAERAAVFGKGDVTVTGVERVIRDHAQSGYYVHTAERFGLSGAKFEGGMGGPKGILAHLEGDLGGRLTDVINTVNRATGVGAVLASDTNLVTLATMTGLKTVNPYGDLMETATELAMELSHNKYSEASRDRANVFLEELQSRHHYQLRHNDRGRLTLQARHAELLGHSEQQLAERQSEVRRATHEFFSDIGGMASQAPELRANPFLAAFAETAEAQRALGRAPMDLAEYVNRGQRFSKLAAWSHTAVDLPHEVKITFDMLGEMKRLGHEGALSDMFEDIRWTKGDPRRSQKMLEYLERGNFEDKIGEVLERSQIAPSKPLSQLEARTGNSVFNPGWERVQENFSLDLGSTLQDVAFAGRKTKVRYVPKLGMRAYKGAPDRYSGGFHSTELEQAYHSMLRHVEGLDLPAAPQPMQDSARAKVSEYLELLGREMGGKEGVLRARGEHPNASWAFAVPRSASVGGADPFLVTLGKDSLSHIEDPAIKSALLAGEDVYGKMFRHPVSAAHSVRWRYSEAAHLGPHQVGIDPVLSGPYRLDHDKDAVAMVFFRKHSRGWNEAEREIADRGSNQWKSLEASKLFQGLEDPRAVSGKMFEDDAAVKGLWGEKSYISELEQSMAADRQLGVAAQRSGSLRNRLASKFVGAYSNEATALQLMLAANPHLRPGDPGFAFLDKLAFATRQVTISAAKGGPGLGSHPRELLSQLHGALDRGEEGLDQAQAAFARIAESAGDESVVTRRTAELTGLTHFTIDKKSVPLDEALGRKANVAADYARGDLGREHIRQLLSGPHNQRMRKYAQLMTRSDASAEDVMRLVAQSTSGAGASELLGGVAGRAGRSASPLVEGVAKAFGPAAGKAAEEMSYTLGAANQMLREAGAAGGRSLKPSGKILAAGLGVAAVAGLLTGSIRSSNSHRPEERLGVTDHVPGEPVAGSGSSVNPKRRVLPALSGVKTAIVSRVQRSRDLEVRARSRDQGAEHEVAKMVERLSAQAGNTNVTVNRVGSWQQSASRLRLRGQIRDELDRY